MKKKFSRILSVAICFVLLVQMCSLCTTVFAQEQATDYYAQYTGSTDASYGFKPNCTFTINKIVNNKFRGRFKAANLSSYSFDKEVEGSVFNAGDSFTCVFTVRFFNDMYYSSMAITVYPEKGYCECLCAGSWHMEDFIMNGEKITYSGNHDPISGNESYNEKDLKLAMALSAGVYKKNTGSKFIKEYGDILKDANINTDEMLFYNYEDTNPDNVAFSIMKRNGKNNSIDMIVVIRGTLKDEWQGNTEITGTSYNPNQNVHDNFNKAKESIKGKIKEYYNSLNSSNVNLIITGHSRGAAVANLYAKEATDQLNGAVVSNIPSFKSVSAYTFATPNVVKYSSGMESYSNIFNFCFKEDLVPTVPPTEPTPGWDYWKYGKTYCASLNEYNLTWKWTREETVSDIQSELSKWETVDAYYNRLLAANEKTTTLYNFLHDVTGRFMAKSESTRAIAAQNITNKFGIYGELTPLLKKAAVNGLPIYNAHDYGTYLDVVSHCGSSAFEEYTYNDCKNARAVVSRMLAMPLVGDIVFNETQLAKLKAFANQGANLEKLGWNLEEPSTWNGVEWNVSGNLAGINLPDLELAGAIDLSGFSSLLSVDLSGNALIGIALGGCTDLNSLNVSGNSLSSLDVSGCTALLSLNCGFNDIGALNVALNTSLTSLVCDDCGLTALDITSLTALQELSCAYNALTALNLNSNTDLTSVICSFNYLDIQESGAFYKKLLDLQFDDCYTSYYPQMTPESAAFNTTELNVLKNFAAVGENDTYLNWLDDDGNIVISALQNNVLFEKAGTAYRITAIDISNLDVAGSLNLTSFTSLKWLNCENTKIEALNLGGCSALESLECANSEITALTLPTSTSSRTTPLYTVSCEYNHIDTAIFTDTIISNISLKSGYTLDYENQITVANNASGYKALSDAGNQYGSNNILFRDLNA